MKPLAQGRNSESHILGEPIGSEHGVFRLHKPMLPLSQPCKTTQRMRCHPQNQIAGCYTEILWEGGGGGVPFGICPLVWLSTPSLLQHRGLMFNCSQTHSCPGSNHLPKRPSGTYGHKILGLWCIQLVQQELFSGRSKCQNYQNRQLRYVP